MKIFLGSSSESRTDMRKVAAWLDEEGYEPICWDEALDAGEFTWESLMWHARNVGAAAFIFAADDKIWYREAAEEQPRDNVLVEYGLFSGLLGRRYTLVCRKGKSKVPSDLAGLNLVAIDKPHQARLKITQWANSLRERDNESNYLVGDWQCEWIPTFPPGEFDPVSEVIKLTVARDGTIRGRSKEKDSSSDYGPCLYTGHEHHFVVSFSYRGEGAAKQLVGGVILQKQPGKNKLLGNWVQFTSRNLIASGSTSWIKA